MTGRGIKNPVPTALQVWRVLQEASGPMAVIEVKAQLPHLAGPTIQSTLQRLARGDIPGLQIQRVMEAVYQPVPEDERKVYRARRVD